MVLGFGKPHVPVKSPKSSKEIGLIDLTKVSRPLDIAVLTAYEDP